jgi:hypothetical protein
MPVALVSLLGVLLSGASAVGAQNLLPNGTFEGSGSGSLAGWTGVHSGLTLASDGEGGGFAARVAFKSSSTYTIQTSPDPVSAMGGATYQATGSLRSDTPGATICAKLLEISASGATVGTAKACTTSTSAWAPLATATYNARTSGDTLSFRVVQTSAPSSGQSFEVDNLSLTTPTTDSQAPTVPDGLNATAPSSGEVDLTWNASQDDVGVTGYTIYRDGSPIHTAGGLTLAYADTTAQGGTQYSYTVDAFDAAGNHSDPSTAFVITTPPGSGGGGGGTVIAAAGDIACDPTDSGFNGGNGTASACRELATSNLVLSDPSIAAVLALGDNQYECGGLAAYQQSFGPTWGRFLSIIRPVVGNHEYLTSGGTDCKNGAAGYFAYFGAAAGNAQADYAWNIGGWHMIALNGQCSAVGGCGPGTPQANFLNANLGTSACTLAYWHQPYYTGSTTPQSSYSYFWQTLYAAGADIVLNGHLHTYARFSPQDASGNVDTVNGIREFIVGTGGKSLQKLGNLNHVESNLRAYGILKLTLHSTSYDWQFVNTAGQVLDSGSAACH